MTQGLSAVILLLLSIALCWIGKLVYGLVHRPMRVDEELTARDNLAFAIPLGAYYLGILIVLGAPLSGQSRGTLLRDAGSVALWGLLAIGLLNLASVATRRVVLRGLDVAHEIRDRRNVAAGIVVGGSHVANALLVLGALSDEGGLLPAAVFWLYAQVLLGATAAGFLALVRYDATVEVRKGNRAAALMIAGMLIALANVLRMSITGPFEGWTPAFASATGYAAAGLVLLFVARWLSDWLLLPGVTIRQEVLEQEVPNVGVGYVEALVYVGVSLLIGWSL